MVRLMNLQNLKTQTIPMSSSPGAFVANVRKWRHAMRRFAASSMLPVRDSMKRSTPIIKKLIMSASQSIQDFITTVWYLKSWMKTGKVIARCTDKLPQTVQL